MRILDVALMTPDRRRRESMTINVIIWWTGAVVLTVGAAFFTGGIFTGARGLVDDLMAWLAARQRSRRAAGEKQ